ncbi:MAG: twin-arginine translocase TatA/TatE family subunit [Deltaproteobacteria bacterium]|nr:twin-arginine translocase TatA/TatE family subunit [Deltaproteobacteria bacterium]
MGLGVGEMLLILFVVLLVFGAGRLPQLGQSLGKALNQFKKAATSNEIDVTPQPPPAQVPPGSKPKDPNA